MANKVIYLRVTDTCNLDCEHCFTSGSKGKNVVFDMEKTTQWVNDWIAANPNDHKTILIHGGEPFLVPLKTIKEFTDQYVGKGIEFGVVSNLIPKLTVGHYYWIKETCGGNIGTSWDYQIRFKNEKMEALWLSNVKHLLSLNINVKVNVSITKALIDKGVEWMYDKLVEISPSTFSLERLTHDGNAVRNPEIFVDNETQDQWFLKLYKEHVKRGRLVSIENFEILEEKVTTRQAKQSTSCRNCEQHFTTLRADGGVSGCPNTADTIHSRLEEGYEVYLDSPVRMDAIMHEAMPEDGCIACDVYDVCGGDCHKLQWDDRCAGYKHLLRYLTGKDRLIPLVEIGN